MSLVLINLFFNYNLTKIILLVQMVKVLKNINQVDYYVIIPVTKTDKNRKLHIYISLDF